MLKSFHLHSVAPDYRSQHLEMSASNGKCAGAQHEDQQIILKEFRNVLQDILRPDMDDQFLLRWLKARNFDIVKAEKMIRESFKFRKKVGADTILTSSYELPEVYQKYPLAYFLGFDKDNSVVRLFMVGLCDYKGMVSALPIIDLMKILIYVLEHDLELLRKKKKPGELDEKFTFILDFQEFSLKQFYDKSVINAGIQLIAMYQDNYPETMKAAYVINVPSYFTWIFNIFKPFLNAVTLSKLKIYRGDDWKEEILKQVDPKYIPGFLGGTRTDPDGNPKCETMISWNCKIPHKYYMKQNQKLPGEEDPSMKSTTVLQRSTFDIPVEVVVTHTVLKWVFMTKDYNIRFGLLYRKSAKSSLEEIIPVESVDCQTVPEESQVVCEKPGIYVLHFDNSYSWLTAKQLYYKVEVEVPKIKETNNN